MTDPREQLISAEVMAALQMATLIHETGAIDWAAVFAESALRLENLRAEMVARGHSGEWLAALVRQNGEIISRWVADEARAQREPFIQRAISACMTPQESQDLDDLRYFFEAAPTTFDGNRGREEISATRQLIEGRIRHRALMQIEGEKAA